LPVTAQTLKSRVYVLLDATVGGEKLACKWLTQKREAKSKQGTSNSVSGQEAPTLRCSPVRLVTKVS
jgi:hypothetical protein